jgi:hypothetical protein
MSIPSDEIKQRISSACGCSEETHMEYDRIIENRLKQLDPEFLEHMIKLVKGVTFWWA